jgi:predicted NBD/HSP70 family sugar kinase
MWLAIDIGGTKTLLTVFTESGERRQSAKFPTPRVYTEFRTELGTQIEALDTDEFSLACVAAPGRIDDNGVVLGFGNLGWRNVPIKKDVHEILGCPVLIENDAKLAALSEARELGRGTYNKVLYITISTGIGGGVIIDDIIDPDFDKTEIGQILLEHNGELQKWEAFASGSAIVRRFHKLASEISDPAVWNIISRDIAVGLIDTIAIIQPDIIVVGGGVGSHFEKFGPELKRVLKSYESPLVPVPPIVKAKRPEEAVVYGCLELMRDHARTTR